MIKILKKTGGISILTAIITASGVMGASLFTAWATANKKTNEISSKVMVVENTEALHYQELRKDLSRIENKLDKVLDKKYEK